MTEEHPGTEHAPSPRRAEPTAAARPSFAAVLALMLAILAAAGVAFLWWQYRQFYVALDDADVELDASLARVRASQRALSDRVDALAAAVDAGSVRAERAAAGLEALPRRVDDLERLVGDLPTRVMDLERRLVTVQGGSPDAQATWLRAEAEHYLAVANAELTLAGRWDNALTALELADERLRALADPSLAPVRRQIADDRLAIESVPRPDLERIVFDLANLEARAAQLPLRALGPDKTEDAPAAAEPGIGRLADSAKRALGSLISIERREDSEARAMSAERRAVARRELATELALARAAALNGQHAAYAASLEAAAALLERDFDRADPAVRAAADLVAELAAVDIAPAFPDISRSLNLLRSSSAEAP